MSDKKKKKTKNFAFKRNKIPLLSSMHNIYSKDSRGGNSTGNLKKSLINNEREHFTISTLIARKKAAFVQKQVRNDGVVIPRRDTREKKLKEEISIQIAEGETISDNPTFKKPS